MEVQSGGEGAGKDDPEGKGDRHQLSISLCVGINIVYFDRGGRNDALQGKGRQCYEGRVLIEQYWVKKCPGE